MRRVMAVAVAAMLVGGCAQWDRLSGSEKGTVIGAGTGAAVGNALGGGALGTIGGAAAGGVVGHEVGKHEERR